MKRKDAIIYLKQLCSKHVHNQVLDECISRLFEVGYYTETDKLGNSFFVNSLTKKSVYNHFKKIEATYI